MSDIKRHSFFQEGLPDGALGMNDSLLRTRPFLDPQVAVSAISHGTAHLAHVSANKEARFVCRRRNSLDESSFERSLLGVIVC